ncbi:MAG: GNAT family N-acetyltransferase [Planctomycetota bacterium]|nr:GNAT family N-acetyltransferase [Planctomycetota bacterium]
MRIAILYNQPRLNASDADAASEAGVLDSVAGFEQVCNAIDYETFRLPLANDLAELLARLTAESPDVVVNFCEEFAGSTANEAHVAALLELLGIPFTGASADCLSLVHDKARTKWLLLGAGIRTAEFGRIAADNCDEQSPDWQQAITQVRQGIELFIKPAAEDASLGIDRYSVVADEESLCKQVQKIQHKYGDVLIERYIAGREFNVGLIELPELRVLPISEIEFQTCDEFPYPIVTYDSKWTPDSTDYRTTPVRCPANVDAELAGRIDAVARRAYRATGCRDYARVDLRVTVDGEIYVLEVNANPDAGPETGLGYAMGVAGIEYAQFVRQLIDAALQRRAVRQNQRPSDSQQLDSFSNQVEQVGGTQLAAAPPVRFRPLCEHDRLAILDILRDCGSFRPDEIEVADEILQESLRDGPAGHYQNLVAELDGQAIGWSCHGLVPLTDATFDLYWIAVHPQWQKIGVGRQLLQQVEEQLRAAGTRWLLAETSSIELYAKTRSFYLRQGYVVVGEIADFYRRDDGKVTFGKRLMR